MLTYAYQYWQAFLNNIKYNGCVVLLKKFKVILEPLKLIKIINKG